MTSCERRIFSENRVTIYSPSKYKDKNNKKTSQKKDCLEFEYPQGPSMDGRIPKGRVQTNQTVERMKYGHLFDFLADLTNSNVL